MEEQAVIEQIEDTAEAVVPEVVETIEVLRNNPVLLVGVGLVAGSVGAFIGYKVARKRLEAKFEVLLEEEIEKTRRYYAAYSKKDEYETPEKAAHALIPDEEREAQQAFVNYAGMAKAQVDVIEDEHGVTVETKSEMVETEEGDEVEEVHEVVKNNIFLNGSALDKDEFDYEAEVAQRSEDFPYVITEDEFFQNEQDFVQLTMTYYEGDDVLCDEQDRTVDDVDGSVGEVNLHKFGHGSKDKNLVYIRNNKRGTDFEIARSRGKYSVDVLGLDDEDARTRPRKFRGGDE